jgi:molybdenum cofactor cytidylyltransferase
MQVNIILLAAGKGQRFVQSCSIKSGRSSIKQLAHLNNKPLINHVIEQIYPLLAQPEVDNLFVTLGANKNVIQAILPSYTSVIASTHWVLGMGHSLAESVFSIQAQSSHVLITLADQALISSDHYQSLLEQSKRHPNKIIATCCDEKLMVPAIFPQQFFAQLVNLQGDKGAGELLKQHALHANAVANVQAKSDVDTLANLEQVQQKLQHPLNKALSHCQTWSQYDQNYP